MINFFLTILSVVIFNIGFSQTICNIQIKQYGLLLTGETEWQISNDRILFKRENLNGSQDKFCKLLTEKEFESVYNLASKINLENNQKDTVENAPDDIGEYDFTISINNHSQQFHLYQVKINEVFNLVKYINSLLLIKYQIGYNDNYFRYLNNKN